MTELEKQVLNTLNDLKIKRQEYKELSEQDGPNKSYFTAKFDAYSYAVNRLTRDIQWSSPELLK